MASEKQPALLALRDTRERTIACLSDAFSHDILGLEEFEQRLAVAHRSNSIAEILALRADLDREQKDSPALPTTALATVPTRERQTLVAILGGTTRQGAWTPPRKLKIVAVLGGVELDFREAAFGPGVTEVSITTVLGGANIIVPPHLAVEMNGIAILGGFEHSERAPQQPDLERAVLRISGLAVLGGVHIETRLIGESEQEAERRRSQRRSLSKKRRPALPPAAK